MDNKNKMDNKSKIALNADVDLLWYIYESMAADDTDYERAIREYIRGYDEDAISDLLLCCFCQSSAYPPKSRPWWGSKYYEKMENGIPVDYTGLDRVRHLVEMYGTLSRDPYDIMIEEARGRGMRAWISVRMNDGHGADRETFFIHDEYFYKAKREGWFLDYEGKYDPLYYSASLDYANSAVFNSMLEYFLETVDRYDADGFELDFMRKFNCFDYLENPDCHKIMTDFVTRVSEYVKKKEIERGHKIYLIIRVPTVPKYAKIFGYDVRTYAERGLVDAVVPTSYWHTTESAVPFSEWKELLKGTKTELWAGLEIQLIQPFRNRPETLKGFAKRAYDLGCDKVYLYNYFRTRAENVERTPEQMGGVDSNYTYWFISDENERWLSDCWRSSTAKGCREGVCRYVMTFRENYLVPVGEEGYEPLPLKVKCSAALDFETGYIEGRAILTLRISENGDIPRVILDGEEARYISKAPDSYFSNILYPYGLEAPNVSEYRLISYEVKPDGGTTRKITFECDSTEILYLEIRTEK